MARRLIRAVLIVSLLVSAGFAAWGWLRPYEWNPDPAARCKVLGAQIREDHAWFWLDVHLKILPGQKHDWQKPVSLLTANGREIQPADTSMTGDEKHGVSELWFKFWLDANDLNGPLALGINDGVLSIKSSAALPKLGPSHFKIFTTHHW